MTYEETADKIIYKKYTTTCGDNIVIVSRKLFSSDDDVYKKALRAMNKRVDWNELRINDTIRYIPKEVCDKIDW